MAWSGEGRSGGGGVFGEGAAREGAGRVVESSLGLGDSYHPEEAEASGGWGASQGEGL